MGKEKGGEEVGKKDGGRKKRVGRKEWVGEELERRWGKKEERGEELWRVSGERRW